MRCSKWYKGNGKRDANVSQLPLGKCLCEKRKFVQTTIPDSCIHSHATYSRAFNKPFKSNQPIWVDISVLLVVIKMNAYLFLRSVAFFVGCWNEAICKLPHKWIASMLRLPSKFCIALLIWMHYSSFVFKAVA